MQVWQTAAVRIWRTARGIGLALVLLTVAVAAGQQTGTSPATPNAGAASLASASALSQTGTASPQPGSTAVTGGAADRVPAELRRLNFLRGTWSTVETFAPSDFFPQGGTGTGRAEIHAGPGMLSIMENYLTRNSAIGRFSGHAVLWYDASAKAYKSFWCDSMSGCESSFSTGNWDGDNLVFTGETQYQGKKIAMRDTFSDIKPDSFTWTEETSMDGGPMKTSLTIRYTKRANPVTAPKSEAKP